MDQNIVALHATNGMLDKDAHATQCRIGSLLLLTQVWVGVLLALARLLRWDGNLITPVVSLYPKIASIDPHMEIGKPI